LGFIERRSAIRRRVFFVNRGNPVVFFFPAADPSAAAEGRGIGVAGGQRAEDYAQRSFAAPIRMFGLGLRGTFVG